MPKLSDAEIENIATTTGFGGLTVDTSIVIGLRDHLFNAAFHELVRFGGTRTKLIFPSIIKGEVLKHLASDAETLNNAIQKAVERFGTYWILEKKIHWDKLGETLDVDPKDFAKWKWDFFLKGNHGDVLDEDNYICISDIQSAYFDTLAPFEEGEQKKNEFPDAIALLTLEAWARKHDTHVLAISADRGWRKFCETSDRVVCIDNMFGLLNYFNKGIDPFAKTFFDKLKAGRKPKLERQIDGMLRDELAKLQFVPFQRGRSVAFENLSAQLEDWSFGQGPYLVRADGARFMFSHEVKAKVEFESRFDEFNLLKEVVRSTINKTVAEVAMFALVICERAGDDFNISSVSVSHFDRMPIDFD